MFLSVQICLADDSAGIAYGDGIGRNVLHHHTTCSDDAAVADGHSRTYRHATSQPTVFTDGYRRASLYRFATLNVVNWMVRSQELAVRTNLRVGANGNQASVEHCAVVVDEHILTQFDAMPVVAMKWRRYGG